MLRSRYHLNLLILVITLVLTEIAGQPPQKIKDGSNSLSGNWPFMVAIEGGTQFCGGVLINKKHVLTAAQCVTVSSSNRTVLRRRSLRIVLSQRDTENVDESKFYSLSHINAHGKWIQQQDYSNLEANIAILTLNEEVSSVQDEDIPNVTDVAIKTDLEGIMLGWGSEEVSGQLTPQLQETSTKVIDTEYCRQNRYPGLAKYTFCTQSGKNDVTVHAGNIGGPFINDWGQIAGIFSYATQSEDFAVNIFTDLLQYKPWIQRILKL